MIPVLNGSHLFLVPTAICEDCNHEYASLWSFKRLCLINDSMVFVTSGRWRDSSWMLGDLAIPCKVIKTPTGAYRMTLEG